MKVADADPPPLVVLLVAVSRADRPSTIILSDCSADPGKQTPPRSGHN